MLNLLPPELNNPLDDLSRNMASAAHKLVNDFLMKEMVKICPEPFLSLYIENNQQIPFTQLKIEVRHAIGQSEFSKTITVFFKGCEFAKAEFSTRFIKDKDGSIKAQETMKELPVIVPSTSP